MSYVLDALKKSEDDRQQHQSPQLLSHQTAEPSFSKNNRFKQSAPLLGLILLISAVVVIGLYVFLPLPENKVVNQSAETATPEKKNRIVINRELNTVETGIDEYLRADVGLINLTAEKKKIRRVESSQAESAAKQIPLLEELPIEIRSELPEIKISGHTFSADQEKRIIIINNTILREGGSINASTKLKEITWEGVIIDYKGLLFRIQNE